MDISAKWIFLLGIVVMLLSTFFQGIIQTIIGTVGIVVILAAIIVFGYRPS